MAWHNEEKKKEVEVPLTEEELLVLRKKEQIWDSAYNEPEGWAKDLAPYYTLSGEYSVESDKITVYRYELDELRRGELVRQTPHFITVIIHMDIPAWVTPITLLKSTKR